MGKKASSSIEATRINHPTRPWKQVIISDSTRNINKKHVIGPQRQERTHYPDAGPLGKTFDPRFAKGPDMPAIKVSEAAKEKMRAHLKLKSEKQADKKSVLQKAKRDKDRKKQRGKE